MVNAYNYIKSEGGHQTEEDYPYTFLVSYQG
jgi:hypothetical protein